jgi:hypothetical protein
MKFVTYGARPQDGRLALLLAEELIDLGRASGGALPHDIISFLQRGDAALAAARDIDRQAASDAAAF